MATHLLQHTCNQPLLTRGAFAVRLSVSIAVIIAVLWAIPLAAAQDEKPQRFRHTVAVAYGGDLGRPAAAQAAEAMARSGAMQQAAAWLERREDVQLFLQGMGEIHPELANNALPLADMLFKAMTVEVEEIGQYPEYGARITVSASAPAKLEQRIRNAGKHPLALQLHDQADTELQRALRDFIRLSTTNAKRIKKPETAGDPLLNTLKPQFTDVLNRIHAVKLYRKLLKSLSPKGWPSPEQTIAQTTSALALAPRSAVLHHARATAYLQQGETQKAINELDIVIKEAPAFADALHTRGIAYLKVHLYNYAQKDIDRAIRIKPRNPEYYLSRGSVHLTEEDFGAMCRDFFTACSLGSCKNYHWARSRKLCSGTTEQAKQ